MDSIHQYTNIYFVKGNVVTGMKPKESQEFIYIKTTHEFIQESEVGHNQHKMQYPKKKSYINWHYL